MVSIGVVEMVTTVATVAGNAACVASVVIMIRGGKAVEKLERELMDKDQDKDQDKG